MAPSINTTKDVKSLKRKAEAAPDAVVAAKKKDKKSDGEKAKKKVTSPEVAPKKAVAAATTSTAPTSPAAPATLTNEQYRASHDITVKGVPSPDVYQSFDAAPFPDSLKNALKAAGFTSPSPIQVR